jgi:hypothetical protein
MWTVDSVGLAEQTIEVGRANKLRINMGIALTL